MQIITTGYEVYNGKELDIDASIKEIQNSMLTRNPEKYGNFLDKLGKIDYALKIMRIPYRQERVELFKYVYFAMRLIDDVVDGDTVPPLSLAKRKELLDSILEGDVEKIKNPLYKALSVKIQELSSHLSKGQEMSEALQEIIVSMNYDLNRIMDEDKTREATDLYENFHRMDITGTIVGTAIIFGINPQNAIQLLSPLGEASRVMYNLRDFGEDILADLINIPREGLDLFGISQGDIVFVKERGKMLHFHELPQSIKSWFLAEIEKISKLMREYNANMEQEFMFEDSPNWFIRKLRNFIMKNKVLPKTYTEEIGQRIPQILSEVN